MRTLDFCENSGDGWEREGFPGGASGKEASCQCRGRRDNAGSTPGLGRSPTGGHSDPPQCPCLENPGQRGRAGYGGVAQPDTPGDGKHAGDGKQGAGMG